MKIKGDQVKVSYAKLFEMAKAGDKAALEQLYNKARRLWESRVCFDPTGRMEPEDFHREAALCFCEKWMLWKPEAGAFPTFILTVVKNKWANIITNCQLDYRCRANFGQDLVNATMGTGQDDVDLANRFCRFINTQYPNLYPLVNQIMTKGGPDPLSVRKLASIAGISKMSAQQKLSSLRKAVRVFSSGATA